MRCHPAILRDDPPRRPKLSLVLLDWNVRESFHSLRYLNQQTVPRDEYEILWVEFYDRRPAGLYRAITEGGRIDRWVTLGYPADCVYHKHRMYNLGILAARGEVCVICDSDAIYTPTFVEKLIRAFKADPEGIVHLDQVRNNDERFYPFSDPSIDDILGPGVANWHHESKKTYGVRAVKDRLHECNYGACMAAARRDMLAVGGADEHVDYLGYLCGPYDLTFRLMNHHGKDERWLDDEYLYHTWHPNCSGTNVDHKGATDGRGMSLRALDARASFRVQPVRKSPLFQRRWAARPDLPEILTYLETVEDPGWKAGAQPVGWSDEVYWGDHHLDGFNVFCHLGDWFAIPATEGVFDPRRAAKNGYPVILRGKGPQEIDDRIEEHGPLPEPTGRLGRLMHQLRGQPLGQLPERLWRKTRRKLARLRGPQPLWQ